MLEKLEHVQMSTFELPQAVQDVLAEAEQALVDRPKLAELFRNCFPNTLETTTKLMDDGSTFVITGDIPAMWLRDSVEQLMHYVPLCKEDKQLQRIISGLIRRHMFYLEIDPYANSFNETANDWHWDPADETEMSPWVWERKFELDSLCFTIRLAYHYWKTSGNTDIFDAGFKQGLRTIFQLWRTEQRHMEESPYRFTRRNCPAIDTIRNKGLGMPVNYTGMIWSAFRPSDDACEFHYSIPSNMFAVVSLRQMQEMVRAVYRDEAFCAELAEMEEEIQHGIELYGIYRHPVHGNIYAYETDGFGNYCLVDDAGTPSLLSMPYLGYCDVNDPMYLNTRKFILSIENPYYFEGKAAKGMGSPHTPAGYIWHMGLSMQGLTANNDAEIVDMIHLLETTDADTGYMHEGFHSDDPTIFTRPWFAWSNSLFSQLIYKAIQKGLLTKPSS